MPSITFATTSALISHHLVSYGLPCFNLSKCGQVLARYHHSDFVLPSVLNVCWFDRVIIFSLIVGLIELKSESKIHAIEIHAFRCFAPFRCFVIYNSLCRSELFITTEVLLFRL